MKSCSFSGHRVLGKDFDYNLLDRVILNLIKNGIDTFYCGMATGFDTAAAESVINYKKNYDVKLVACIPCENQTETFSQKAKERYELILNYCDEQIIFAPVYFDGCMQQRDRYLVDNCDVLVCYLRRKSGGTYYTVNYAKKTGKKTIEL